ncbi:hypothetical protein B0I35DRAFT_437568 [Stachybotrys elegans]|uniref:Uncharacterized protein n=1 Tax=Stachybotrys elegans TaxID=80388 RepID=A0A8K0SR56_9HYPO|nr:hypothetical protein B0I35DRAFT_437568 [Stachybotrys elegans]
MSTTSFVPPIATGGGGGWGGPGRWNGDGDGDGNGPPWGNGPPPAVFRQCYNSCNAASMAGNSIGTTEELCEDGSTFLDIYAVCANCIQDFDVSPLLNVLPGLSEYLEHCEIPMSYTTMTVSQTTGSPATMVFVLDAPTEPPSSLAFPTSDSPSSTNSIAPTLASSGSAGPATTTSDPANQGGDTGQNSNAGSQAWIAGPVIGSLAGLAMILGILFWVWRRRQRRQEDDESPAEERKQPEKPTIGQMDYPASPATPASELPATNMDVHEMEGSTPYRFSQYIEKPANEPAAPEADSDEFGTMTTSRTLSTKIP